MKNRTTNLARSLRRYRPLIEVLEARLVFASDFGDAPLPYRTLLAEAGAEHVATGPTLGVHRDTEANGMHSPQAVSDDLFGSPDDEDGVQFDPMRSGQLGATAQVTVTGGSARLDAWIDFNQDGTWGGPWEQIADNLLLAPGNSTIRFDVPSWAPHGNTFARFRLSAAGDIGVAGVAATGEVEDHSVTIGLPKAACACFKSHTIYTGANGAESVFAADVDSDGDMDVLSGSVVDDRVNWYENDGNENFTFHNIGTGDRAFTVFAADVDGDGDTDALSASFLDDSIKWYENDGNQNFTSHAITTSANGALSVYAADIDADGDIDVLSASAYDQKIAWYENDGSENFTLHVLNGAAVGAISVYAADMDSDGDMDVVSGSHDDEWIRWYENDGSQNFTTHDLAFEPGINGIFAIDVDRDNDTDLVSASFYDHITWYENDGNQNFTSHKISTVADNARIVYPADLDGDGDIDVMSASMWDNTVAWYENDGNQNFATHIITTGTNGARSVHAADVDGDGDLDVLSASRHDDKVAWYENHRLKTGVQFDDSPAPTSNPIPIPPPGVVPLERNSSSQPTVRRTAAEVFFAADPIDLRENCTFAIEDKCKAPGAIATRDAPLFDTAFSDKLSLVLTVLLR